MDVLFRLAVAFGGATLIILVLLIVRGWECDDYDPYDGHWGGPDRD